MPPRIPVTVVGDYAGHPIMCRSWPPDKFGLRQRHRQPREEEGPWMISKRVMPVNQLVEHRAGEVSGCLCIVWRCTPTIPACGHWPRARTFAFPITPSRRLGGPTPLTERMLREMDGVINPPCVVERIQLEQLRQCMKACRACLLQPSVKHFLSTKAAGTSPERQRTPITRDAGPTRAGCVAHAG